MRRRWLIVAWHRCGYLVLHQYSPTDWPDDFDATLASAAERGHAVGQSGCIGENGRFAYLETEAHAGTVVEISEVSGPKGRFFAHIARVAADWDGSEPVRPVGG